MAWLEDWEQEAQDAFRKEQWKLHGPGRIVKVVPVWYDTIQALDGYITVGKYLIGQTPFQIRRTLGLPLGSLMNGARIYSFKRLPLLNEYEYELTTYHPDGQAFNPAHHDPTYPRGSRSVHQWRIKKGMMVPVDDANALELKPGQRFPYRWLLS